ncbi:MAG: hypothetical protein KC505_04715 [Myxococcales bacterium]|nr:hypothetical protein [Myxococcales bacterium]USN49805.1 MAG: hypothetical protein H6731_05850 [Myxococcales bacterium]
MISSAIFFVTLLLTLIGPLIIAIILGFSYFFINDLVKVENFSYRLVRCFYFSNLITAITASFTWFFSSLSPGTLDISQAHLDSHFSINIRLFYDNYSITFLLAIAFISSLIGFFSHRYLHRDPQYRRFFIIISTFIFGMNLIVLAGTMDLIFAGWEIVGLASFLLIAYFWHRPKAVAAATKAYYIYRFCDLGLLTSILVTHFFWQDVSLFGDFQNLNSHSILSHIPNMYRWILSLGILLPVLGKSAQIPFCFWLPKAMEGPTHSSAIFYGSLSVHAGVFLLMRTMPIWYHTPGFVFLLGAIGLLTAFCSTLFAQVQSNIKGQIGYASIAQVGLMLVELSLGFEHLAFIHMIGNAILRCFQLLVSGSILTTHLHMQRSLKTFGWLNNFSMPHLFPNKLKATVYAFAVNDGYFEYLIAYFVVNPTLFLSNQINALINRTNKFFDKINLKPQEQNEPTLFSVTPALFLAFSLIIVNVINFIFPVTRVLSLSLASLFSLCALGEKKSARKVLIFAILSSIFAFLSLKSGKGGALYSIGLLTSALLSFEALSHILKRISVIDLRRYHGLFQQFPLAANVLLMGILGIITFPLSSTFFGEDFLLSLALDSGVFFIILFHTIFVIIGISLIRMYAFLLFGRRHNYPPLMDLDYNKWQIFLRLSFFMLGNIGAFIIAFV